MIFLRIRSRIHQRASEWFCAATMATWGATLLHPSETFASPSYDAFARTLGEDGSGFIVGTAGVVWLIGLIINGARQRATSTIRAVCAFFGAVVYGLLGLGFFSSFMMNGLLSTGIGTYFGLSILALYSLYWIAIDKRTNG